MKSRPTSLPHTTLAPWRKRVAFQPRRSTATFRAFTEQRFPLTCANGESTRRRKRFYRERAFPQRRSRQGTVTQANSLPHSNAKWAPRPRHSKDALDKGTATNARISALGASLPIWTPCRAWRRRPLIGGLPNGWVPAETFAHTATRGSSLCLGDLMLAIRYLVILDLLLSFC